MVVSVKLQESSPEYGYWFISIIPLFAPVMAMILSLSWTVLTGPGSGIAFILAADDVILPNV